jgi:DNA-binding PadR family transcriptional regulator
MKELPRLSALESLILAMLCSGEMYGLEMVKASDGKLKRGTIYVTLGRMEDKGYIRSREVEDDQPGPPKRVYRITGEGARAIAAWHAARTAFVGAHA